MSYIERAISRSRSTLSLLAVVVVAGLLARAALPIANDPHVEVPYFYIGIVHEGISPEDAERLLVQPMEIELRKLEGLVELSSTASEGVATIFVEIDVAVDVDTALSDVREAVDRARAELPGSAEEPIVEEISIDDFPIVQINLVGEQASERSVYQTALHLRDDIEAIPSVLGADLQGQREELLEVTIDPDALNAYRISSEELIATLERNNRLIPAGSIDTGNGRFSVKVPGVVEEAGDVLELPIRSSGDKIVTLADVATVRRTFKDRTSFARYNGRDAITINVTKRAEANIIDTVAQVLALVDAARPGIPAGIEVIASQNQAEFAELRTQINDIATKTKFGSQALLDGTFTGRVFQVGANNGDTITVGVANMGTGAGALAISTLDLTAAGGPAAAITALDTAITTVSTERGKLGATQNRFESVINNLQVTTENLVSSESRIRDVDMASEMTNFTKNQVLMQAGTSMLGQANSLSQSVLSLLQ